MSFFRRVSVSVPQFVYPWNFCLMLCPFLKCTEIIELEVVQNMLF